MKVVIIEDEAPAARRLIKLLNQIEPTAEVLAVLESVESAQQWFAQNTPPDMIFSDIQLSDNLSFEFFNSTGINIPIIFTTAYDQYAIRAFEHMSIDYLLKPIREEHLAKALKKFRSMQPGKAAIDTEMLLRLIRKPEYRDRFLVYSGENLKAIPVTEVAYMFSEDGDSFLVTNAGKKHILSESLDKIEQGLDHKRFFRANRQFIVSVESVLKVSPDFNQKLKIHLSPSPESEVIVSKLRATEFKTWLNS